MRRPITGGGCNTYWRRHVRDAGIAEGFRRHDTRHTAGTRYVRATGNFKGAQKLLGHARIETTTRYAHVLLQDVRARPGGRRGGS
jgi:site-specific recombinase XerD